MLLADDYARCVRATLGQAHLAYWNLPEASGPLKRAQAWLDQPFPVAVEGGHDELRAIVAGVLSRHTELRVDEAAPLACLLLPGAEVIRCRPEATVALVPDDDEAWSVPVEKVRALVPLTEGAEVAAIEDALGDLLRDAATLRTTAALDALRAVVAEHPIPAVDGLADELEDIAALATDPGEMELRVAVLRDGIDGLGPAVLERARQLFEADPADAGLNLDAELNFWRAHAADRTLPATSRERLAGLARVVERLLA